MSENILLRIWRKIGGQLKRISNPLEELNCKLPENFLPRIENLASTLGNDHKWEVRWCRDSLIDNSVFCAITCIKCNERYVFDLPRYPSWPKRDAIFGLDKKSLTFITKYSRYNCDENIIKDIIE